MAKRCKGLWALLFIVSFLSLVKRALSSFVGDGLLQVDVSRLSEDEANEIIRGLEKDNLNSDRALEALKNDLAQLREEEELLETETKTIAAERLQEKEKKLARDAELTKAKEAVQAKEASIAMMSVRETELKGNLAALESKVAELEREREETEKMYTDPSLLHVLSLRANQWDSVPQNAFNKTRHDIFPAFYGLSHITTYVNQKVGQTSPALALLASLLIYGLCLFTMLASWKAYKRVRGQLSIPRMIFLGDVICAMFWSLVIVCYLFLFTDPLHAIQERSTAFFFAFQMLALISYAGFIFLRVIVLSCKMSLQSLGETLAVMVVGQHYYVRVWKPAVVDDPVRGALFYYMCYVAIFGAFAASRMTRFFLRKQRGESRSIHESAKMLWHSLHT